MFLNQMVLILFKITIQKTEWVYLREMVQVFQDSEQREATFNITSGIKQQKHICLSSTDSKIIKSITQPSYS